MYSKSIQKKAKLSWPLFAVSVHVAPHVSRSITIVFPPSPLNWSLHAIRQCSRLASPNFDVRVTPIAPQHEIEEVRSAKIIRPFGCKLFLLHRGSGHFSVCPKSAQKNTALWAISHPSPEKILHCPSGWPNGSSLSSPFWAPFLFTQHRTHLLLLSLFRAGRRRAATDHPLSPPPKYGYSRGGQWHNGFPHSQGQGQEEGEDDTFIAPVFFCLVAATIFYRCVRKRKNSRIAPVHTRKRRRFDTSLFPSFWWCHSHISLFHRPFAKGAKKRRWLLFPRTAVFWWQIYGILEASYE